MTTSSIGSNSRDYATPALWWVDVDVSTSDYIGEMYNDSEFTSTTTTFLTGTDGNATYHAILCPAVGEGFKDHADVLTNALRYNVSNGVAMRVTANYQITLSIDSDYFELTGLQIGTGTSRSSATWFYGSNSLINDCILEGASASEIVRVGTVANSGTKVINTVIVQHTRVCTRPIRSYYHPAQFLNCTIVSLTASTTGVEQTGISGSIVKNCGIFGFTTAIEAGTYGAGTDYNATDDSSLPAGSNNQLNLTTASQFEDVSSLANLDLRAVSTGSLDENGTRDQTNTNDLDIVEQDRSTTTPTIGAWEVVSAVSTFAGKFQGVTISKWNGVTISKLQGVS